jgi:aconitate hydratase
MGRNKEDLKRFSPGDKLRMRGLISLVREGKKLLLENVTQGFVVETRLDLSPRVREILLVGGLLAYIREKGEP